MVKKTNFDKNMNRVSLLLMVVTLIVFVYQWMVLPDSVPVHSDIAGNVDRWGSKAELLVLPIIPWILYGLLSLVEHFPKLWNTLIAVTSDNLEQVYSLILHGISSLKFCVTVMLCGLVLLLVNNHAMLWWFLGCMLASIIVVIIYWMRRVHHMRVR